MKSSPWKRALSISIVKCSVSPRSVGFSDIPTRGTGNLSRGWKRSQGPSSTRIGYHDHAGGPITPHQGVAVSHTPPQWDDEAIPAATNRRMASRFAKIVVLQSENVRTASISKIIMIGVDLAKNVFQLHAALMTGTSNSSPATGSRASHQIRRAGMITMALARRTEFGIRVLLSRPV